MPTANKAQSRLYYLRVASVVAYIIGIALSHKLWIGASRAFPTVPLIDGFKIDGLSTEYILPFLLIIALASSATSKRPRRYLIVAIVLAALMTILDQTRLQPWVYQYLIILSALSCYPGNGSDEAAARCLVTNQIVVASLYFWSGIQKLNWTFCHEVIPTLLGPHLGLSPHWPAIGVGIAICETLIGICLLIQRTRQIAAALAMSLHSLVLIFLILTKQNSIVWPWNISMLIAVPLLFWRAGTNVWKTMLNSGKSDLTSHFAKVVLIVCGALPALSFIGLWDLYLSAALYSGNTPVAVVRLSDRLRNQLPLPARSQVFTTKHGELMLPFYEWSMAELNAPPYPETRVYMKLARHLCKYAEDPREIELIIKERPAIFTGKYIVERTDCSNVNLR